MLLWRNGTRLPWMGKPELWLLNKVEQRLSALLVLVNCARQDIFTGLFRVPHRSLRLHSFNYLVIPNMKSLLSQLSGTAKKVATAYWFSYPLVKG